MKSRPTSTSLGPATILLLVLVLLLLQVVSCLASTINTTAFVLSGNNNNKPLLEDEKAIDEKSRLPYTYKQHVARQKDYNDEYIKDWFASILYPKLKTGNDEPEIFYRGDTVVVTYLSSFDEPQLDVFCYNNTKQSGGEDLTWPLNDHSIPAHNGTRPVQLYFDIPEGFNVTICTMRLGGRTKGDPVYASIVVSEEVPFKYVTHYRDEPALIFSLTGVVTEGTDTGAGSTTSTTLSTVSSPTASSSTSSLDQGPTAPATTTGTQTQTNSAEPISKEESKSGTSLGPTALAGIGAGAGVAVVAIAAICFFFFWRARQKQKGRKGATDADADEPTPVSVSEHKKAKVKVVEELYGQAAANRGELYSPEKPQELGSGTERHEINGGKSVERIELP